jgi:hypothetical protein
VIFLVLSNVKPRLSVIRNVKLIVEESSLLIISALWIVVGLIDDEVGLVGCDGEHGVEGWSGLGGVGEEGGY